MRKGWAPNDHAAHPVSMQNRATELASDRGGQEPRNGFAADQENVHSQVSAVIRSNNGSRASVNVCREPLTELTSPVFQLHQRLLSDQRAVLEGRFA